MTPQHVLKDMGVDSRYMNSGQLGNCPPIWYFREGFGLTPPLFLQLRLLVINTGVLCPRTSLVTQYINNRSRSSFFPVPDPETNTRHILELWKYVWSPAREDYDRVSYQPVHIVQPWDNPSLNVSGLNAHPNHPIMLEELSTDTIALLQPHRTARQEPPPRRPLTPVLGSSANPIVVMESAETNHQCLRVPPLLRTRHSSTEYTRRKEQNSTTKVPEGEKQIQNVNSFFCKLRMMFDIL